MTPSEFISQFSSVATHVPQFSSVLSRQKLNHLAGSQQQQHAQQQQHGRGSIIQSQQQLPPGTAALQHIRKNSAGGTGVGGGTGNCASPLVPAAIPLQYPSPIISSSSYPSSAVNTSAAASVISPSSLSLSSPVSSFADMSPTMRGLSAQTTSIMQPQSQQKRMGATSPPPPLVPIPPGNSTGDASGCSLSPCQTPPLLDDMQQLSLQQQQQGSKQ